MSKITKIEQYALADFIFTLYEQGLSTRQVSERIKTEKGFDVSYKAVAEFLEKTKADASQISRSMREEHIRKKLPGHLGKLDCIIEDLYKEYKNAELKEKLAITRELRPTIELVIGRAPEEATNPIFLMSDEEVEVRARAILARRNGNSQ
jgi:transposase